jgi:hypothetical protein
MVFKRAFWETARDTPEVIPAVDWLFNEYANPKRLSVRDPDSLTKAYLAKVLPLSLDLTQAAHYGAEGSGIDWGDGRFTLVDSGVLRMRTRNGWVWSGCSRTSWST